MAFLVLALPVLPCADDGADADKSKTGIVKQNTHQEEQEHDDACSPFCHCTCCAGFSINHLFDAVSSLVIIDNKSYTSYLPDNLIAYSPPVWQPPQLKV